MLVTRLGTRLLRLLRVCPRKRGPTLSRLRSALIFCLSKRAPPEVPPLEEIRARVAAVYQSSQREKRLAAAMDELRARYEVVVE